ncbi:hypothetical protein F4778DRAFT_783018 [Xylariomycetidae sp. FL2044]|nr:hypothetical protein F4778DRAFT_783018 [Xylariomycetidae sp. FL2044]
MSLPDLTDTPQRYPNSCLTLSHQLIHTLDQHLGQPVASGLVLSVGCGNGLLEAHLHGSLAGRLITVEGVEVAGTDITYLPEERTNSVPGTWALCRRAADADALMFVYPRSAKLVESYVREFVRGEGNIRIVLWLGPRADWEVFRDALTMEGEGFSTLLVEGSECGVGEYEMLAKYGGDPPIPQALGSAADSVPGPSKPRPHFEDTTPRSLASTATLFKNWTAFQIHRAPLRSHSRLFEQENLESGAFCRTSKHFMLDRHLVQELDAAKLVIRRMYGAGFPFPPRFRARDRAAARSNDKG